MPSMNAAPAFLKASGIPISSFEKYQISVIEEKEEDIVISHPDRDKRITEKALEPQYGKKNI